MFLDQGNLAAALASDRAALSVAEGLVQSQPRYARSQLDLLFCLYEHRNGGSTNGRARPCAGRLQAARAVMARLKSALPDDPNWPTYLDWIHGEIAKLNG